MISSLVVRIAISGSMVLELWSNFMVVHGICQVFKMGDSRRRAVAAG